MFSHWAYILVGHNNTGKTSFQRDLLWHLCGRRYARLRLNVVTAVEHPRAPKGFLSIFTCNRSFQEKRSEYKSVEYYFKHFFKDADVCILSSHSNRNAATEISSVIRILKRRCYNVAGVFWSNAFDRETKDIAMLPWNEIMFVENPIRRHTTEINEQLDTIAKHFSELLIARANVQ